jgi:hypothetical protein
MNTDGKLRSRRSGNVTVSEAKGEGPVNSDQNSIDEAKTVTLFGIPGWKPGSISELESAEEVLKVDTEKAANLAGTQARRKSVNDGSASIWQARSFQDAMQGSGQKPPWVNKGWPRGTGREAVLAELEEDPKATPKEIAERADVSERYAQKIMKEHAELQGGEPGKK